jgi:predicted dehydrogenase
MAIELTPEQKAQGKTNFETLVGYHGQTRRDFLGGLLAAGAVLPVSAAAYYGYTRLAGDPVRAALIGAGDEGGVLVGEHNPDYLQFVAVCDLRPSNQKRIFTGEPSGPRKGLRRLYGNAADKIKVHEQIKDVLERKDIQAVVIALPLHLHAPVAIAAMKAGKHVLCEKLMAWNVAQCKDMIRVAEETDRVLSIGHQRHYSMLYAYAQDLIRAGELGQIHHIRAYWHRHNALPVIDPATGLPRLEPAIDHRTGKPIPDQFWPVYRDSWKPPIPQADRDALETRIRDLGYQSLEELVRWRLYHRTGGGLMAELGSHQLDACGIFLGKARPLAVSAVGGKFFYRDDRDAEDHVFCTFEFPGKNYWKDAAAGVVGDKDDRVIVAYSSINTNRYEPYGECVMGTGGTLILEREEEALLFPTAGRGAAVTTAQAGGGKTALDATATFSPADARGLAQQGKTMMGAAPPSKGYREEMEHFAFCVKMWENHDVKPEERPRPRCEGPVALADAIIALTANVAMRGAKAGGYQPRRIEFRPEWFDPKSAAVPDDESAGV